MQRRSRGPGCVRLAKHSHSYQAILHRHVGADALHAVETPGPWTIAASAAAIGRGLAMFVEASCTSVCRKRCHPGPCDAPVCTMACQQKVAGIVAIELLGLCVGATNGTPREPAPAAQPSCSRSTQSGTVPPFKHRNARPQPWRPNWRQRLAIRWHVVDKGPLRQCLGWLIIIVIIKSLFVIWAWKYTKRAVHVMDNLDFDAEQRKLEGLAIILTSSVYIAISGLWIVYALVVLNRLMTDAFALRCGSCRRALGLFLFILLGAGFVAVNTVL